MNASPMTVEELEEIAAACDRLLRRADAPIEWVASPWLHVPNPHPVTLQRYAALLERLRARRAGMAPPRRSLRLTLFGALRLIASSLRPLLTALLPDRGATPGRLVRDLAGARYDAVIVSPLVHVDHLARDGDFYFADLQARFEVMGLRSLLLLRNQTGHPARRLARRATRVGTRARMLLPDVSSAAAEWSYLRRSISARLALGRAGARATTALDLLVAEEARRNLMPAVVAGNLRLYDQIAAIAADIGPRLVLTLYEGHPYERCLAAAVRDVAPRAIRVSYQQTLMWRQSLAVLRSIGGDGRYDPDLILTSGEVTRRWLSESPGLSGVQVMVLGSFRRPRSPASAPREEPAVLVLPDGSVPEILLLFRFAIECAVRLPETPFILRTHPLVPFERIAHALAAGGLPPNVEVSRRPSLDDDLGRAGQMIVRGSSTVVSAVLAGLRPFYVEREGEIDLDLLFALPVWRERVRSVEEFVRRYAASSASDASTRFAEWSVARAHCEGYLSPFRERTLDAVLAMVSADAAVGTGYPTTLDRG